MKRREFITAAANHFYSKFIETSAKSTAILAATFECKRYTYSRTLTGGGPTAEMKMREFLIPTLVALSLAGSLTALSAQTYGEPPVRQQESSQPSIPSGPTDRGYLAE